MRNGSLDKWLHPMTLNAKYSGTLSLDQRLNIVIDVASALHYLHHECEKPIIHCDLKPSNVLLDDDMIAHVSDFGIARLISTIDGSTSKQTSTIGVKGTIGYAPPEYGMGAAVSMNGDMYSFGILVLEMFTGRKPTDEIFGDCQNLHNYVKKSFSDDLFQILDPSLVPEKMKNSQNLSPEVEHCLASLFNIGLACSVESAKERMTIIDVNKELNKIRNTFLACKLQQLNVGNNKLNGGIPSFIGNFSSLILLSVGINNLEGDVPHEICHLKNLVEIYMPGNKLIGTFPFCLYNMSSLIMISAAANQFNGSLPPNMFHTLSSLKAFLIGDNQISGTIPSSITNASLLSTIEITENYFVGQVPGMGKLHDLQHLALSLNNLGYNSINDLNFLKSLTNCSKLQLLAISYNNFGGHLPNSLGNLSTQLDHLYLGVIRYQEKFLRQLET
ncbi:hypothetical protein Fmac_002765 [Flemingia macrophylla]|uniref:non-specific serine/threonine protein kinase n=1 Tax=Flemingia macrophylla TaxID=520843 RepID=A0ABD1NKU4_9FABA